MNKHHAATSAHEPGSRAVSGDSATSTDMDARFSLGDWRVRDECRWVPVPSWAERLATIGCFAAVRVGEPGRITTLLALPTIHYAATFVALGAVQAFARDVEEPSIDAHIATLKALPPNAPVKVIVQGREKDGILEEIRDVDGTEHFFVRHGTTSRLGFPVHMCSSIQPSKKTSVRLHKNGKGHEIIKKAEQAFLEAVFPGVDATLIHNTTQPRVVVIGEKARLEQEMSTKVRVSSVDGWVNGSFAEAINHNLVIHSDRNLRIDLEPFDVVVMASAIAYLRFSDDARAAQRIVLLDRCERQYVDAITEFNRAALDERENAVESFPPPPDASEAAAYMVGGS